MLGHKSGEQELEDMVQGKKTKQTAASQSHRILRSLLGTMAGVWGEIIHCPSVVRAIGPHVVSGKRIKET